MFDPTLPPDAWPSGSLLPTVQAVLANVRFIIISLAVNKLTKSYLLNFLKFAQAEVRTRSLEYFH
jgi:hypothetical protein